MSTAVAIVEEQSSAVVPAMDLERAQATFRELSAFIKAQLVHGEDFGTIPGTPKPSLYQPGAQKIAYYFGLSPEPKLDREVLTAEFVSKTYTVRLTDRRTGLVIAACAGSCNSTEQRFQRARGDARQNENTIDKMAQKRALVGAVIIATRASGLFTQDTEDLPREQLGQPPRQYARGQAVQQGPITADTPWPFGKYQGTKVRDLPDDFIAWAVEPGRKFGPNTDRWVEACSDEIGRRIEAHEASLPDA